MAFSFGQSSAFGSSFFSSSAAASAPSLFGASSTPAFGATTSAFGASFSGSSSPSLFGSAAPASSSAFSFGGASTGAFGATSTPSAFGAASAPNLFGGTTTSAFGASSSSFSFGSQAAGSLFGAPATSTALTPFQPAQQQALVPQPGLQVQAAPFLPATSPEVALNELNSIYNAYDVNSPSYRFKTLFLNRVDNPAQRVKPANVDEHKWQQALKEAGGPNNPDKLWPVQAHGFKDLLARATVQSQAVTENRTRLAELRNLAHMMNRKHAEVVRDRSERMQNKHRELIHRLLHVWRLLDALEARRGANSQLGCQSDPAKEIALRRVLSDVAGQLMPTTPDGLNQRLEDVAAAARLRISGGGTMDVDGGQRLDQESVAKLYAVLQEHVAAVKKLQQVLHTDQMDVKIIKTTHEIERGKTSLTMTAATG